MNIAEKVGGVNVFGGGLALYNKDGKRVGALGVSGDTSCKDHIAAWYVRHAVNFDNVPGGVGPGNTDNLNLKLEPKANAFEHPYCGQGEEATIPTLQTTYPVGPNP